MTLTYQSQNVFSYKCEFERMAATVLFAESVRELTKCFETLEAYNVAKCSDYPAADYTTFRAIDIQIGPVDPVNPALTWMRENTVVDCGQKAVVISNVNPGGEVDIYYKTIEAKLPSDIGVASRGSAVK